MDLKTIEATKKMICADLANFHQNYLEVITAINTKVQNGLAEFKEMVAQIPNTQSGPFLPKTPKPSRMRIATIPENEVVDPSAIEPKLEVKKDEDTDEERLPTRSKRAASIKASKTIKKQQSISLNTKLRRPSTTDGITEDLKPNHSNRFKRPKASYSGSEEDDSRRPLKQSKMENIEYKHFTKPLIKMEPVSESSPEKSDDKINAPLQSPRQSPNKSSVKSQEKLVTPTILNETPFDTDATLTEQSLYEDAIGKPSIPMNSTMNPNSTITIDKKILNVTVLLEKMNETRTITRSSASTRSTTSTKQYSPIASEKLSNEQVQSSSHAVNTTQIIQNPMFVTNMMDNQIDGLITDDESSPDRAKEKIMKKIEKLPVKKRKRVRESIVEDSDEDVVMASPIISELKPSNTVKRQNNLKYKSNQLFSPYAKDSVKKRVEAFEQVRLASPKTQIESTGRITRTKTRAMTANADNLIKTPNVVTQLARKSLAKAKKISLAKQKREYEEEKENTLSEALQKTNKVHSKIDKLSYKPQARTTPISKSRLQMPMSVSRIPHTPINSQLLPPSRAMTASRAHNTVSSTESLTSLKSMSKSSSTDSLAEKKNKLITINDEDARKKKEDALKAQMEEKRRKREEKELKNKLAREAKEKLEQEKRLKQDREKEEKARNALMMQEKLRQETEKKRLEQLLRVLEKEERRKQEEQLKLQRLQEQEETERLLAEQKRREQEAERRRIAETRAQQSAAAEAARLKQQYQAKVKLLQQKQQQMQEAPTSYKIDSDPDDESDSESKPKYKIPLWAKSQVRQTPLEMQQYIPIDYVLRFFGTKKCTPDLSELFVGIKKERLQRTSSAIWIEPPRFSMMEDE